MLSVSVGWQIYDLTRDPFYLGLVGLVQFTPALLLVLVTGSAADRFGRRNIMALATALAAACAAAIFAASAAGAASPGLILGALVIFGVARAFLAPASSSLVVSLVPTSDFANAVAWNSSAWQAATIIGPVAGGVLYGLGEPGALFPGHGPEIAYAVALAFMTISTLLTAAIPQARHKATSERPSLDSLLAGFRFIWKEKVVLGAISLDLFAVLLGGAVALMPAFARDILHLGPWGLGLLRAAPGVGAISMAGLLAASPIRDHAGRIMFAGVALFGVFTAVFGLSQWAILSIVALVGLGAADMVSVVIRETLLQLWTPDHVRGRVNAVNSVFVGASNELGEFRAGMMAAAFGVAPAVVFGGVASIAVAVIWSRMFPQLRLARHLDGRT